MGARDRLKNANMQAMNAVDQTLESLNRFKEMESADTETKSIEEKEEKPVTKEVFIKQKPKKKSEKKVGRPAKFTEDVARLTLNVTSDLKDKIGTASMFYGGSITDYITTLINKDLKENYEVYKKQEDIVNSFKVK